MQLAKIAIIAAVVALILLCWAPWLSEESAIKQCIARVGCSGPRAPDANLTALASPEFYEVSWAPFGKLVKTKDFLACGYISSTSAYDECVANNKPTYVNLFEEVTANK